MTQAASSSNKQKSGLGASLRGIIPRNKRRESEQKQPLEQRLAYRDELIERLASKEKDASDLHQQIARLRVSQGQARTEVAGFEASMQREARNGGEARSKARHDAAKAELRSLSARIADRESRFDSTHKEIESLRREIQDISQGASIDEVKAHLEALADQRATVDHLEELVRDMQARPAPEDFGDDELDALQQAREELLADIALGTAKQDELVALDGQIAEILDDSEGHQADAMSRVRDYRQTLNGLTHRLSVAKGRYDELANKTPEVIEQLLIARAGSVYEEYRRQAGALMESFHQLQGLQRLLSAAVPESQVSLLTSCWPLLFIPAAGSSLTAGQEIEHLYRGKDERQEGILEEDRQRAFSELAALGVEKIFESDGEV